jgi:hypothetical protein
MNMYAGTALTVSFVVCGIGTAAAQAPPTPSASHVGVAVKVSTLGVGIDVATPVHPRVNVRVGVNFFSLSHDFDNDGITLAAQLKARSFETHLDWFPLGGGFHISPGLMLYNGNEVDAAASVPGGKQFSLGDSDLISDPANPVTGNLTASYDRKVAPSILIGWGNLLPKGNRRWSVPFELGVVFSTAPTATLNLTGGACATNGTNCRSIAGDATLQNELTKQQNDINSDLSDAKVYPVLSLGFSYRF